MSERDFKKIKEISFILSWVFGLVLSVTFVIFGIFILIEYMQLNQDLLVMTNCIVKNKISATGCNPLTENKYNIPIKGQLYQSECTKDEYKNDQVINQCYYDTSKNIIRFKEKEFDNTKLLFVLITTSLFFLLCVGSITLYNILLLYEKRYLKQNNVNTCGDALVGNVNNNIPYHSVSAEDHTA